MTSDNIIELMDELLGSTEPEGDTNVDRKRKQNLTKEIEIVDVLIQDVLNAASYHNDDCASAKDIGMKAYTYAIDLKKELEDFIKENE